MGNDSKFRDSRSKQRRRAWRKPAHLQAAACGYFDRAVTVSTRRLAESDGEMLVCVSRATGGRVVIDA